MRMPLISCKGKEGRERAKGMEGEREREGGEQAGIETGREAEKVLNFHCHSETIALI